MVVEGVMWEVRYWLITRFKIYIRRFKLGGGARDDGSGVRSGVLIN